MPIKEYNPNNAAELEADAEILLQRVLNSQRANPKSLGCLADLLLDAQIKLQPDGNELAILAAAAVIKIITIERPGAFTP